MAANTSKVQEITNFKNLHHLGSYLSDRNVFCTLKGGRTTARSNAPGALLVLSCPSSSSFLANDVTLVTSCGYCQSLKINDIRLS